MQIERVHKQLVAVQVQYSRRLKAVTVRNGQSEREEQRIQYNTIQYNTIQYNTIQYNTIQYNTIQYNTIQYNTIQYNTIQYNTIQYNTTQYNSIQYKTVHTKCSLTTIHLFSKKLTNIQKQSTFTQYSKSSLAWPDICAGVGEGENVWSLSPSFC